MTKQQTRLILDLVGRMLGSVFAFISPTPTPITNLLDPRRWRGLIYRGTTEKAHAVKASAIDSAIATVKALGDRTASSQTP